jgi:hypothetical protein
MQPSRWTDNFRPARRIVRYLIASSNPTTDKSTAGTNGATHPVTQPKRQREHIAEHR